VSGEENTENTDGQMDDAARAAAFLDPEGASASSSASEDGPSDATAAFLESDSDSTEDKDEATEAAAAFLTADREEEATEEETASAAFSASPDNQPKSPAAKEDIEDEDVVREPSITLNPAPDDGIERRWYAVHAHSGQEATVQRSLIAQAEIEGLADLMTNVLVPMEEISEFKSGEKKFSKRKYFPGYLLVQLPVHPERYADLWHLIKDTTGVTGFIGSRNEPTPLEDEEVMNLVEEIRGERERPVPKINFEVSERIKIIDGAFANFFGNISEINVERGRMKVMIEIFERQTSIEVEFWQVEKI